MATKIFDTKVKLFIINNPQIRNTYELSEMCDCSQSTIVNVMKELNIPKRSKPINCKG